MLKPGGIAPLLPDRHPQADFFMCDIFDATPKSDMASMEYPLFTLSTRPDRRTWHFESRDGSKRIRIAPSDRGRATVHDRDVLIYCISQLMAALKQGRPVTRTLRIHPHDLLRSTNRDTSGDGYKRLHEALYRLSNTALETNITTGGREVWDTFNFIDGARTVRETRDGRIHLVEVTLSDWVFNAIDARGGDLLTISRDYFRLRKPLERRLYEIARKQCGTTPRAWRRRVDTLHIQTGSQSTPREFRRMLGAIIAANDIHDHIPDYTWRLDGDVVVITPRPAFTKIFATPPSDIDRSIADIHLASRTYEVARQFAGGYDLYGYLEPEWRRMLQDRQSVPRNPDGSFIAFVKAFVRSNGTAWGDQG